jgi:hypothetical protein
MSNSRFSFGLQPGFPMLLLCFLAATNILQAQSVYLPTGHRTEHLIDRIEIKSGNLNGQLHTASKPYRSDEVVQYAAYADSLGVLTSRVDQFNFQYLFGDNAEYSRMLDSSLAPFSEKPFLKIFYREPATLIQVDVPAFDVRINPVINLEIGSESGQDEFRYLNTRGLELRGRIDQKVAFYLYASENQGRFMQYVLDRWRFQDQAMPGEGRGKPINDDTLFFGGGGVDFFSVQGYIDFPVTRHIQVQFGQDKNFIGDGYRSLVLSDNSKDYLFLKIKTKVWKLEYQNIFAEMADYREENISDSPIRKKYMAMHRLGINIGKNANVGAFESVIFGPVDSTGRTGFDLYYLNPLIFYRAVEFNLGSLDNVMIGVDFKVNFLKSAQVYGQFFLDEFNFSKFREGNGWWANKFGVQAGLKYIDAFGLSNLDLQTEFNTVRPYTYGHFDQVSSYSHFAQPLAHPLGANFREGVGLVRYQPLDRLELNARVIVARYGVDTAGSNWGGNILLDNDDFEMEFGNSIGQGVAVNLLNLDLTASWQLFHDFFIDLRLVRRAEDNALDGMNSSTYIGGGIRWNAISRDFGF